MMTTTLENPNGFTFLRLLSQVKKEAYGRLRGPFSTSKYQETIKKIDGLLEDKKNLHSYDGSSGRRTLQMLRSLMKLQIQPSTFNDEKDILLENWTCFRNTRWLAESCDRIAPIWLRVISQAKDPEKMLIGLETFFNKSMEQRLQSYIFWMKIMYKKGDLEQAIKYINRFENGSRHFSTNQQNCTVNLYKLKIYNKLQDFNAAIQFGNSLKITNGDIVFEIAKAYLGLENFQMGEKYLCDAVAHKLRSSSEKQIHQFLNDLWKAVWNKGDNSFKQTLHEKFFVLLCDPRFESLPIETKDIWYQFCLDNVEFAYECKPEADINVFLDRLCSIYGHVPDFFIMKVNTLEKKGLILEAYELSCAIKKHPFTKSLKQIAYLDHIEKLWREQIEAMGFKFETDEDASLNIQEQQHENDAHSSLSDRFYEDLFIESLLNSA